MCVLLKDVRVDLAHRIFVRDMGQGSTPQPNVKSIHLRLED